MIDMRLGSFLDIVLGFANVKVSAVSTEELVDEVCSLAIAAQKAFSIY